MKNTIKRDKLGAVIAPTTKEENVFWANRKEIMGQEQGRGPRPGRDRLEVGA